LSGAEYPTIYRKLPLPIEQFKMSSKIVKAAGAQPDELELSVAQELLNLEVRGDCSFYLLA
jgi:hypothetical protein